MIRASVESWRCSGSSNQQQVTMSRRQQRLTATEAGAVSAAAAASRPGGQRSVCEKLMLWILTNPNCVLDRWGDDYLAMDLTQGDCASQDAVLRSIAERSDKEDACELSRENINIVDAERFRCTDPTTNLRRTS